MNSSNRLVRLAVLQALACASGMILTAPTNAGATGDNAGASPTPANSTTADSKKEIILLAQTNTTAPKDQSTAKGTADDKGGFAGQFDEIGVVFLVGFFQPFERSRFIIRVNNQYRLCLRWTNEGPTDVEIVDYH